MLKRVGFISMLLLLVCACFSLNSCRCDTDKTMKKAGSWELPVLVNNGKEEIPDVTIKIPEYIEKTDSKLVLLTFNATWGEPTKGVLAIYQDFYEKYQDQGLAVIGISIDNSENLREIIIKDVVEMKHEDGSPANITYPVCWDLKQEVKTLFCITSIPVTFLINKENKIVYEQSGFSGNLMKELEQKIKEFLNQ